MMNWFRRFMSGRYGVDQLSYAILSLYVVVFIVSLYYPSNIWYWVTVAIILICYFRIFSRNTYKRSKENAVFLKYWNPIRSFFRNKIRRIKDFRSYKYYKCPNCHTELRVPKGRGDITIKCPKCRTKFDKRT